MKPEFEGLSLVELIDLLEPAPPPPAISMLPQTAGWIWMGIAVIALAGWGLNRWLGHRRANAYRRAALAELEAQSDNPAAIALILRRAALAAYPREQIAPLTGENWLRFLDDSYGGTEFSQGPGAIVAEAPYRPCPPAPALAPVARKWIIQHQGPI